MKKRKTILSLQKKSIAKLNFVRLQGGGTSGGDTVVVTVFDATCNSCDSCDSEECASGGLTTCTEESPRSDYKNCDSIVCPTSDEVAGLG